MTRLAPMAVGDLFRSERDTSETRVFRAETLQFYKELYPWDLLVRMLEHGEPTAFPLENREFSVTQVASTGDEYFTRHLWAETAASLKKKLTDMKLVRIDVGAVHTTCVSWHTRPTCKPIIREMVFDIDAQEYTRECCSDDKKVCERCWIFIECAVAVLDRLFRERLRFSNVLWVSSGRRGVHAWILDRDPCASSAVPRRFVLDWIASADAKSDSGALRECRKHFQRYHGRSPCSTKECLESMWPKIDGPVTLGVSHLLKAPLSVHPATGRVCVPFRPEDCAKVYPAQALRVDVVLHERRAFGEAVELLRDILDESYGKEE